MKEIIFDYTQVIIAALSVIIAILFSLKSVSILKKGETHKNLTNNSIELEKATEGLIVDTEKKSSWQNIGIHGTETKIENKEFIPINFELRQLENYYSQALNQSKISFWFSILFASIGFIIIIIAGFLYSNENSGATIVSMISGTIIDSIAALFFIQTKRAQKNMNDFFQKLREDKQYVEAKKLCESLNSIKAKDALKIQLALNFSRIPNSKEIASDIVKECIND